MEKGNEAQSCQAKYGEQPMFEGLSGLSRSNRKICLRMMLENENGVIAELLSRQKRYCNRMRPWPSTDTVSSFLKGQTLVVGYHFDCANLSEVRFAERIRC